VGRKPIDKRLKNFELVLRKIHEAQCELERIDEWSLSLELNKIRTKVGIRWRNIERAPPRKK